MFFSSIYNLPLPHNDRLSHSAKGHHFRDALGADISNLSLTPSQLQYAIFAHMPGWVHKLMSMRNRLVKLFGFKVGQESMTPGSSELKVGDSAGFMKVIETHEDEIISYAEDRHMAFYLSVSKRQQQVVVSTLVNQKTFIGRLYVNAILPFHYVIARVVINNAVKAKRI